MMAYYGCTRELDSKIYNSDGFESRKVAHMNVYGRTFEDRNWKPPLLRMKW